MDKNLTPTQQNPLSPVSSTPPVQPKPRNKKILIMTVIHTIVALILVYFVFQYTLLKRHVSQTQPTPIASTISTASPTTDLIANWKTYTNKEFGFSIKYPEQWTEYKDSSEPENIVMLMADESIGDSIEPLLYYVNIRLLNKFPTEGADIQSLLSKKEKVNGYSVTIVENEFAAVWHRLDYFFKYGQDRFLEISLYPYQSYIADNNSLPPLMYKYKEIFDQMISTFKFTQ